MSIRLTAFSLALVVSLSAADAPRPNLIVINIDDLGYGEIGPFGGRNRTPHLDRMAAEGRKLTSHYAAPVCSPSRASLMTGSYAKRALPIPHVLFPAGAVGLNPAERTIAEVLKDAGYTTAMIGKWHLGDQPEFLPTRQGFDSFFGLPYSNDMGPAADGVKSDRGKEPAGPKAEAAKNKKTKAATAASADDEVGQKGPGQPPLALLENEKVVGRVRREEQIDLQRRYTERAVGYIRQKHDRPFFLYFAPNAVHFPRYPRDEFMGKSGHGLLGDWVQEIDWSVGEVLGALRDTKLADKTLVIFTSDNGGPVGQGAVNTPLRGAKGSTWEGGVRVCTLAWWPGQIPAGTSTDAITTMFDVLPTFAALAGAKLPADRKIDGVDQWPVLAGNPAKAPRDTFFYFAGLTLEAVRSGAWKLRLASGELFNLKDDIGEATDLAAQKPDEVKRLRALADTMAGDLGLDGRGPGCRPLGRVDHPKPIIAFDGTVRPELAGEKKAFP
ncbi:MAG: sulfatase [Verrucomicrobia bacterium]|nr:sulfatase [Verrucomicrobiota bacterium]